MVCNCQSQLKVPFRMKFHAKKSKKSNVEGTVVRLAQLIE